MKITRFVNGQKVTKPLNSETVIKNEVISQTINKVNERIKGNANQNINNNGAAAV